MNNQNITLRKELIALDRDTDQEYKFRVEGKDKYLFKKEQLEASIEETEDGFTFLEINGVKYPVEIVASDQNLYEVLVNGITYAFSVETPFSLERRKILSKLHNESTTILLKAPMPGKIIEVLVKTGDSVKAGDTLLILEAMKMQNAILASSKATVKKVLARAGDTTSKSDLLIELERD